MEEIKRDTQPVEFAGEAGDVGCGSRAPHVLPRLDAHAR